MTIELEKTKEHAIEQAAHDISKAKAFSKLAQEVMVADVGRTYDASFDIALETTNKRHGEALKKLADK